MEDIVYIVICGCGRVGAQLATMLTGDDHNVVVIDADGGAFRRLGSSFNGLTVVGNGFDEEVLERAGIKDADIFVAVTNLDNANIMAGQVAMKLFNVPKVISRVYYPDRERTYQKLGVETVCGTTLVAQKIRSIVLGREYVFEIHLDEKTQIVEVGAVPAFIGKKVEEIEIPGQFRPIIIARDGKSIVVDQETTIAKDDNIIIAIRSSVADKLSRHYAIEIRTRNAEGLSCPI